MNSFVLGVEIGGTKLQLALGVPGEEPLAVRRGSVKVEQGAQGILDWIAQETPPLLATAPKLGGQVAAIGVGFGGPIESATGRVLVSHTIRGWEGVALKRWFEDGYGLPTIVANDSNAAGWAEYCCGAGRGTRHFCYMNIGSGIGGALVLDGRLHDGQGFGAAEIGHTYAPGWGKSDTPDKLENVCSGWAIEKRLRTESALAAGSPLHELCHGDPSTITCAMLGDAARRGDVRAQSELEGVADCVGLALANVITLFHPERVAMGGGVSLMGDVLLDPVRRAVDRYVFGPFRNRYSIVPCELGEAVVLVGAMLLAASNPRQ